MKERGDARPWGEFGEARLVPTHCEARKQRPGLSRC